MRKEVTIMSEVPTNVEQEMTIASQEVNVEQAESKIAEPLYAASVSLFGGRIVAESSATDISLAEIGAGKIIDVYIRARDIAADALSKIRM